MLYSLVGWCEPLPDETTIGRSLKACGFAEPGLLTKLRGPSLRRSPSTTQVRDPHDGAARTVARLGPDGSPFVETHQACVVNRLCGLIGGVCVEDPTYRNAAVITM